MAHRRLTYCVLKSMNWGGSSVSLLLLPEDSSQRSCVSFGKSFPVFSRHALSLVCVLHQCICMRGFSCVRPAPKPVRNRSVGRGLPACSTHLRTHFTAPPNALLALLSLFVEALLPHAQLAPRIQHTYIHYARAPPTTSTSTAAESFSLSFMLASATSRRFSGSLGFFSLGRACAGLSRALEVLSHV